MKRVSGKADKPANDSPAALYDEGLRHFQSGRPAAAEERCRLALASDPRHADSLHLMGLIRAQANQIDPAIELIVEAIRHHQGNADYFSNLGTLLARRERFDEALKSYDLALKLRPDFVEVWISLGDLLQRQKRYDEALLTYDHALTLDPRSFDAANKGALLLVSRRRFAEALERFERSDAIRPGRPETLYNKGLCLQGLTRLEEAAASYTMSLAAGPNNYQARNNLGAVLIQLDRYEEAVTHFYKAAEIDPGNAAAFNNIGLALIHLRRFDEAVAMLGRAIVNSHDVAELFNNRGTALKALGRLAQALADFDKAIALKPSYSRAHCNRGSCLDELRRPDEALASYGSALALEPDYGDAHWNLAINRLRAGDFHAGWRESEWRWRSETLRLKSRPSTKPLWLGAEPLAGKTLLVYNDQGFGDAIQFCRYIPLLAAQGAQVILQVDRPLKDLLSTVSGVSHCLAKGEDVPDHDLRCPLMSLPRAFDSTLPTIPSAVPYVAPRDSGKDWKAWLGAKDAPRVGLVWSGNPNHLNDHNRSIALKTLAPLFEVGAQFVSLQKNPHAADLETLRARGDLLNADAELASFVDTAGLMQYLDLVISVDTSVAHLAGALGKPVWILLSYVPDWRWLYDRDDSPWYPTARLFRQSETRIWDDVISELREALQDFVAQTRPGQRRR